MRDIAPCPFCGGKGKVIARYSKFYGENLLGNNKLLGWTLYIKCNKCHSRGKPISTEPIKLYADNSYRMIGSFYQTRYWANGEGLEEANQTFAPYIEKAIEAWNTRWNDKAVEE